jgi:Bacteriocin-protection, YdeI or OmpD-Associated/Domain of unknown function (DUF1905)
MARLKFKATVEIIGVNPFVLVSAQRASQLKPHWRKPMPVLIRLNGEPEEPWPINMMPVGNGSFRLYLHGTVRKASGTGVGDRVQVEVQLNSAYKNGPQHAVPSWFRNALRKNNVANKNWEKLIPSRKKEILRYLASLKSAEALERNLQRALRVLGGAGERFLARPWNGGE